MHMLRPCVAKYGGGGGQVNALDRLQNILPCKVKELIYRAFVLPHFYYCSRDMALLWFEKHKEIRTRPCPQGELVPKGLLLLC